MSLDRPDNPSTDCNIGAAGPIFLVTALPAKFQPVFIVLKQFGTGVIISTAFVHVSPVCLIFLKDLK
jgi:hypothetical protein